MLVGLVVLQGAQPGPHGKRGCRLNAARFLARASAVVSCVVVYPLGLCALFLAYCI